MYELYPYFTNDGSVGLFSPDADDIYHSTYGALTEAYEKFILPANFHEFFKKNSEIKILDICFGIGYNTKSFINNFLEFLYNGPIDTNKKCRNKYIAKLYTNNKKYRIFIHAVDYDKTLANLSPFFISNKKNFFNKTLNFKQDKIQSMLSGKTVPNFYLKDETKIILLELIKNYIDGEAEEVIFCKELAQFLDRPVVDLYKFYKFRESNNTLYRYLYVFLHNIYYKYISTSYKKALKALKLADFNFKLSTNDARQVIASDDNQYDFIFLDAFTPAKCPSLWTVDFFKELYKRLNENGMILTYSNSAAIRNAFVTAGFFVGKIYSESSGKFTGTIAVKNKELIKYHLSEYDLGLMKTKAGIFYRDKNLNASDGAIIEQHKKEVENSDLMSSSRYIKTYGRKK